jgi:short-subunit dehydrogenase involved in D-alanine esterification of teichoic acids
MTAEILHYNKKSEQEPKPAEIALITGGAGGIGKEIVKRLSLQGKTVIIGTRSSEKFESIKSEVKGLGGNPLTLL